MSNDESSNSNANAPPENPRPRPLTEAKKTATCSFVRTLLANHPDLYDEASQTMSRETLLEFVRAQRAPGGEGSLEKVFAFFSRVNQTPFTRWLRNLLSGTDFFSTEFPGSKGDHPGSTDTYRRDDGNFDPAAFDRVTAHSSNGRTMSQKDFAAAIIEANDSESNPGSALDLAKSAGEFALLFNLLGREDGNTGEPIHDRRLI